MDVTLNPRQIARFWSKVDRTGGEDACWPWLAARDKDGYGKFQFGPKGGQTFVRASRLALFLANGAFEGLALHSCDHPACCNPRHLRAGTQLENRADAVARGRTARGDRHPRPGRFLFGERHHKSTITDEIVRDIRSRGAGGQIAPVIAAALGISINVVRGVLQRKSWRHVA